MPTMMLAHLLLTATDSKGAFDAPCSVRGYYVKIVALDLKDTY